MQFSELHVAIVILYSADCRCSNGEGKRSAGTTAYWCTGLFCWTPCHDQGTVEHCSRLVVYRYIGRCISGCFAEPWGDQRPLPREPHRLSCCKEGLGMFSLQSKSIFLCCVLKVKANALFYLENYMLKNKYPLTFRITKNVKNEYKNAMQKHTDRMQKHTERPFYYICQWDIH